MSISCQTISENPKTLHRNCADLPIWSAWLSYSSWGLPRPGDVVSNIRMPYVFLCWSNKGLRHKKRFMTFELSQAVRPNILSLKPYRCARDDYSFGILLDANENTHGPSLSEATKSQNICGKHGQLERYPDPHQVKIEAQLSLLREPSYHGYHTYLSIYFIISMIGLHFWLLRWNSRKIYVHSEEYHLNPIFILALDLMNVSIWPCEFLWDRE